MKPGVMNRIGFHWAGVGSQLFVNDGSSARIVVHVDDPTLCATKKECEPVWNDLSKNLRLKESKYVSGVEVVESLGCEYQHV